MDKRLKVLTISDSFKGSLTSFEVGEITARVLKKRGFDADFLVVSDGGEGFLSAIQNLLNVEKRGINARLPLGNGVSWAEYLWDKQTKTAYVELAEASGITKLPNGVRDPFFANTFGTGEVMAHCVRQEGAKRIVVGLGGSASVDMGAGLLEALGVQFFDKNNVRIQNLCNQKLGEVARVQNEDNLLFKQQVEVVAVVDVTAKVFGAEGAVHRYAKQKGANTKEKLARVQKNCEQLHAALAAQWGAHIVDDDGLGAAGGVAYGLKHVLGATKTMGIDMVLELMKFGELVPRYDVIITGEGQYDEQSLQGKVVGGVAKYAPKRLIVITGKQKKVDGDVEVYAIVPSVATLAESLKNPKKALEKLIERLPI